MAMYAFTSSRSIQDRPNLAQARCKVLKRACPRAAHSTGKGSPIYSIYIFYAHVCNSKRSVSDRSDIDLSRVNPRHEAKFENVFG